MDDSESDESMYIQSEDESDMYDSIYGCGFDICSKDRSDISSRYDTVVYGLDNTIYGPSYCKSSVDNETFARMLCTVLGLKRLTLVKSICERSNLFSFDREFALENLTIFSNKNTACLLNFQKFPPEIQNRIIHMMDPLTMWIFKLINNRHPDMPHIPSIKYYILDNFRMSIDFSTASTR